MNVFDIHLLNVLKRDGSNNELKGVGMRLAGIYAEILELNIKSSLNDVLINVLEILKEIFKMEEVDFHLSFDGEVFVLTHNLLNICYKEVCLGVIEGYLNICLVEGEVKYAKRYFTIQSVVSIN